MQHAPTISLTTLCTAEQPCPGLLHAQKQLAEAMEALRRKRAAITRYRKRIARLSAAYDDCYNQLWPEYDFDQPDYNYDE